MQTPQRPAGFPVTQPATPKRILVIGGGGREHAIVRQLAMDSRTTVVYAVPGSDGMRGMDKVECISLPLEAPYEDLLSFAADARVELIVIGPEQPLADGLADFARVKGFRVFAPSKDGARLEASKIHADGRGGSSNGSFVHGFDCRSDTCGRRSLSTSLRFEGRWVGGGQRCFHR